MAVRVLVRILLPSFVGAVIAYFLTGLLPKVYSSYETLYFPLNSGGGVGTLGAIGGGGSGGDVAALAGLGGAIVYPVIGSGSATAAGIVTSHTSLETVVRRLHLDSLWHTSVLNATKALGGQVTAESDRAGMLVIRVNSSSPALCVAIDRALYAYLQTRTRELSASANSSNKKFVVDRLEAAERELKDAEARVVEVMQHTPLASVSDVQRGFLDAQKALSDAKINRDQERARLGSLEAEYHRLANSSSVGSTVNALTTLNPAFGELAQELQRRRLQLSDAMIAYSETSPRVYQARKQYENAEAITNQVKAGSATSEGIVSPEIIRARSEMAALDESVRANEAVLASQWKDIAASPQEYAKSTEARSDFEAALSKVGLLRQELDRADVIESRDPSRFALMDEPYEDPTPISPHRLLVTALTFFAIAFVFSIPFVIGLVRAAELSAEQAGASPP